MTGMSGDHFHPPPLAAAKVHMKCLRFPEREPLLNSNKLQHRVLMIYLPSHLSAFLEVMENLQPEDVEVHGES